MATSTNNDGYNADELEAPDWLNAQFFTEVLSNHEKTPELKVVDVHMSPASAKGDHYASIMFRGKVTYTTQKGNFTKSLIIKTMPELDGHKKEMLGESFIFQTEIGMYTKVLPAFEKLLREIGDDTKLYAECIYHSIKPHQLIVFEDLVPQGYAVVREREANIEELQAAFSKLGKWHAVSLHTMRENPDFLKEFTHGLCELPGIMSDPFMTDGMRLFIDLLDTVPELVKYKPFFKKLENDYLDRLGEVMLEYRKNPQPNGYYILCHGDFHLRNMMFKHNKTNGNLEDCMLIDFQICNLCPITVDIIYSIYMLMGPEDRRYNYKELINFYFSVFVDTLKKLGFKGEMPNVDGFWKQIANHKYYELFIISTFLPMMYGLKSNNFDPADILQKEEIRKQLYYVDDYIEDLKLIMSRFESHGYFD